MTYKIIILPLAKQDIKESAKWYNEKQKGLGLKFTKAIRHEVKFISRNPLAIVNRYKEIHTCVVDAFPFMIHYFIDESIKSVVVTAVYHTKQSPSIWDER